jgi:hypothetical protein
VFDDGETGHELHNLGAQLNNSGATENAIQKFEHTFRYSFEELDAAFRVAMEDEKGEGRQEEVETGTDPVPVSSMQSKGRW